MSAARGQARRRAAVQRHAATTMARSATLAANSATLGGGLVAEEARDAHAVDAVEQRRVELLLGLLDLRREDGWRTTYEDAAAVDALGAFALKYPPAGNAAGSVEIAGETITHEGPGSTTRTWPLDTSTDHRTTITASGDDPLHVVITTSGHRLINFMPCGTITRLLRG